MKKLWTYIGHIWTYSTYNRKYVGVSINGVFPKCLVYNGKSHLEMDDLGVPLF
jgi:hypothetical protein